MASEFDSIDIDKFLNMHTFQNPKLIIITGPSGAGKTTARNSLQELGFGQYYPEFTTRRQRANEEDGVDYFFRTKSEVEGLEHEGKVFIKTLFVNNEYYGHLSDFPIFTREKLSKGHNVIIETTPPIRDWKDKLQAIGFTDYFSILLYASLPTLESRIRARDKMSDSELKARLAYAEIRMQENHDYVLCTECLDNPTERVKNIVLAETRPRFRDQAFRVIDGGSSVRLVI